MTTWEGDKMDFGEPQIYVLEYGTVNIISRTNVVNTLKDCIRNWKTFVVTNDNCGEDTKPGTKDMNLVYRIAPGTALTQFIRAEYTTICFERQIFSITYGNKLILLDNRVYANANEAYQVTTFTSKTKYMKISNDTMKRDPQPGVRKKCIVEIDGINKSTQQPKLITGSFWEGSNFPTESLEGGIPGRALHA